MRIQFYSVKGFEASYLQAANKFGCETSFTELALSLETVNLAVGYDAVSIFTNDDASAAVLENLQKQGVKYISTRAAGYDNIDLTAGNKLHLRIANVPNTLLMR
jgi:D-lactate dehydrogenase